jgi:CDP-glycerol glycerophosphotransferase (TagB/SpsB family)
LKKFLIYASEGYAIPIGMPLQKEIDKRGYEVRWFCDERENLKYFTKDQKLLESIDDVFVYNPDVVLVTSNVVADFFPGIKVQIFHGFSVGKRSPLKGHFNIRGFFDLYCTQGPSTTEVFKKLQKRYRYFQVIQTGWSKIDPLFPIELKKPNKKPVVMISSTFTTRLSLAYDSLVVDEIERLSMSGEWSFIAVLHPKMQKEVVDKFKSMQNENFKFYDTTNLIPLFKEADIMLSDTTSAISEFLLQKKVVVTINNNSPANYMINITKADEIEDALRYALTSPKEIMENINKFIEETHPYDDGRSSKRVVDACLDFLEHHKLKRKPLNLIRRYKIRKKLRYFKF